MILIQTGRSVNSQGGPDSSAVGNGVVAANMIPLCVVVNTGGGEPGRCRFLLMVD